MCSSPWPVVCRNKGIHHHHCTNKDIAGIFMQTFQLANQPADGLPGNVPRKVTLFTRLLKGYDENFGKSLVAVWIDEVLTPKMAAVYIDTKWDTHATVLSDVKIADYPLPAPDEHNTVNLTVAIIPIDSGNQETTTSICRLNLHSVLGEFISES